MFRRKLKHVLNEAEASSDGSGSMFWWKLKYVLKKLKYVLKKAEVGSEGS